MIFIGFIAIARAVVNHDGWGGVAPDPLVWSAGARPKRTSPALCYSGSGFSARAAWNMDSDWITFLSTVICSDDIVDCSFCPGIDIWRSCRFIAALTRSLCLLPEGLVRFVSCSIGAYRCRLRHIGTEKCGHGLASRPRESASVPFLDELLFLFRYPVGSWRALLAGTLPLRYCFDRFACRTPTWRLPASGRVGDSVAASVDDGQGFVPAVVGRFFGFVILVCEGNEFDSTEKKPSTPCRFWGFNLGHVCGKDCVQLIFLGILFLDTRGGVLPRIMRGSFLLRKGQGWVNSLGVLAHVSGLHVLKLAVRSGAMREVM